MTQSKSKTEREASALDCNDTPQKPFQAASYRKPSRWVREICINISGLLKFDKLQDWRLVDAGAPAGDADALMAMTPKTSASRGKSLNLTASSICCRIISLEKRSSSDLCRSNVSLRNQSRPWLCIVAILSRHIWTMKCIRKPLIEAGWIRFQLNSGFSMSPHIESREVESQQIAIVARGDKLINRKGEKKQQSIKQLN